MEKHEQITSALNLLKRLPPQQITDTLKAITQINESVKDDVLRRSFLPFKLLYDTSEKKYYVGCEYNEEEGSFRSPWGNTYYPPLENGYFPSEVLRNLEIQYNLLFDDYRSMYYDGGVSCVYLWDLPSKNGFAGAFCVHKDMELVDGGSSRGVWNIMHTIKVTRDAQNSYYSMDSDLLINFEVSCNEAGSISFGTRNSKLSEQRTGSAAADVSDVKHHISIIGAMLEEAEMFLRRRVEQLFIPRIREVARSLRPCYNLDT